MLRMVPEPFVVGFNEPGSFELRNDVILRLDVSEQVVLVEFGIVHCPIVISFDDSLHFFTDESLQLVQLYGRK